VGSSGGRAYARRDLCRLAGKHFDLVPHTKRLKGESHEFFLDMKSWVKFRSRYRLTWDRVPFASTSRSLVPQERGIYAFSLELTPSKLPQHGYILYVGITGDGTSASNLRRRYSEYERQLNKEDGRPAVLYMLKNWKGHLVFNFAPLPNPRIDLAEIEGAFINSVMPPINKRDYEPELRAARAAAF
jgi:hypothetical protein